jgi:DNA-binding transcriptional MerR regulator
MAAEMTIGTFSRITHLSIKTLRHYHDWGLLEPAAVDEDSGYRLYSPSQVPMAQMIRRFRDLEMPIEQVKAVLAAEAPAVRERLIAGHLKRMEEQLAKTQEAVSSLRSLLEGGDPDTVVIHALRPTQSVLAITATVSHREVAAWWRAAFAELRAVLDDAGAVAAGPPGGIFDHELFADEVGECTVYLPVVAAIESRGRAVAIALPRRSLAIATHRGPHRDIDLTYAALGTHVTEQQIDAGGPVHERYLTSELDGADPQHWRTEVGWPITVTDPSG